MTNKTGLLEHGQTVPLEGTEENGAPQKLEQSKTAVVLLKMKCPSPIVVD